MTPAPEDTAATDQTGSARQTSRSDARWRPSISAVLIFGFGVLVLVAVGSVMGVLLSTARQSTLELLGREAETTVSSVIERVDRIIGTALNAAEFVALLIAEEELDPNDIEHLEDVLMGALAGTPEVTAIGYIDPAFKTVFVGRVGGKIVRHTEQLHDSRTTRNLLAGARISGQRRWYEVAWSEELNEPHVTLAVPIEREGIEGGAILSLLSVRALSQVLLVNDEIYGTNSFILHGRDQVLAHPSLAQGFPELSADQPLPPLDQFGDEILKVIWQPVEWELTSLAEFSDVEARVVAGPKEDHVFLFQRIDSVGPEAVYVGVHWPEQTAGVELRRLILAAAIALVILLAAVILAFGLGRSLARPIRDLSRASAAIGELNLRDVTPLAGSAFRELNSAANAYNAMLRGLRWFEAYVPRSLVVRLMRLGEGVLGSEERTVTVLFTDLVGFTRMSSRLSASQVAEILNLQFGAIISAIEAEDGTVDKFMGDAVMAYWGAPEDQPGQASQACRAALAAAAKFESLDLKDAPNLRLRIGIHTGPAVVGNIGAPGRVNYTLIGDSVNTAQRLEALGKQFMKLDDSSDRIVILISGDTAAALDPGFNLEALGEHRLPGRFDETEVHRLWPPATPH